MAPLDHPGNGVVAPVTDGELEHVEDLGRGRGAAPAEQFHTALVPGQRVAFGTVRTRMIRRLSAGPGILVTVRSF